VKKSSVDADSPLEAEAKRVELTVSCLDCAELPKVGDAGQLIDVDGVPAQVMHNGVLVEPGGYFGDWMAEIIRRLKGHHEPQEELVFARVLERLCDAASPRPTAIELGSFWAYYSLWFLNDIPQGSVLAMEPEPDRLDLGQRNFKLNGRTGQFIEGVVGPEPGVELAFTQESNGKVRKVQQYDLAMLMRTADFDHVDLLLCDVQGGESHFFTQSETLLRSGAVRFAIISTHHHSISGDPLTHQKLLEFFSRIGAHIIAEHTVGESFSGDGLIAVAFDKSDADLVVHTSFNRQGAGIYPALEFDLAAEKAHVGALQLATEQLGRQLAEKTAQLATSATKLKQTRKRLNALENSRAVRYSNRTKRLLDRRS
jgi:FkbM family methyltransferase